MKTYLMIFLSVLIYGNVWAQSSGQVKVRINSKVSGTEIAYTYHKMFEDVLVDALETSFPCVSITTDQSIREGFEHLKQLQLKGEDSEQQNADFSNMVARVDIYVFVRVSLNSYGLVSFTANCRDAKYEELASCSFWSETSELNQNYLKTKIQSLIDDLKYVEICTYTGPITIEVKSERDETESFYIPSPCGGDNALVTATRKVNMTLNWDLYKGSLHSGYGNVKYDLKENYTTVTNFPCYKCKNGDQGPVKITEIVETEAKTEGISTESISEGKHVDDVRIGIVFFENGTYSILVKATSKKGVQKNSAEKKFEGMCESESEPKDTKDRQINVPLEITLGPYAGTSEEKTLHQKETIDLSKGQEKTSLTIDFTLTRKQ